MTDIVIYGVGSTLIVDVEESLARAKRTIVAGIRNFDGPVTATPGYPIIDATAVGDALQALPIVIPLFLPSNRRLAVSDAFIRGFRRHASLIDPTAIAPRTAEPVPGLYINAGAVLGAAIQFGKHVLINRGASVGHHCQLDDFVSLGPRATLCGGVVVEAGALIGAAAVVLPRIRIGAGATVGAGAVVTRDVRAGAVVVGNPARVLRGPTD